MLFNKLAGRPSCPTDTSRLKRQAEDFYAEQGLSIRDSGYTGRSLVVETLPLRSGSQPIYYKFKLVFTSCSRAGCQFDYESFRWQAPDPARSGIRRAVQQPDDDISRGVARLIVDAVKQGVCIAEAE